MTLAAELATARPESVDLDDTVFAAAQVMRDSGAGALLVTEDDRPYGIITDRDVVVRVLAEGASPKQAKVRDACSTDLATVGSMDPVEEVEALMRERALRRVAVVDRDGVVVGLVALEDVIDREHPESPFAGALRHPAPA